MKVVWQKSVEKSLKKLPWFIVEKFRAWVVAVETDGIRKTRLLKGLHDEPLAGNRKGQRSVRLSKSYRAFYIEKKDGSLELIEVIEVNKHGY